MFLTMFISFFLETMFISTSHDLVFQDINAGFFCSFTVPNNPYIIASPNVVFPDPIIPDNFTRPSRSSKLKYCFPYIDLKFVIVMSFILISYFPLSYVLHSHISLSNELAYFALYTYLYLCQMKQYSISL